VTDDCKLHIFKRGSLDEADCVDFPLLFSSTKIQRDFSELRCIEIPESVCRIEDFGFSNLHNIEKIILPASIADVGWFAFNMCSSLKKVVFKGKTLDEVKKTAFWNTFWTSHRKSDVIECIST